MSASAGRVLLLPKGTYAAGTTYYPLDYVFYNGSTYVCKAETLGNLPTNTTYWQIMAQGTATAVAGNYYGECASAANVQNKVVSVSNDQNFTLQKGAILGVKFTNTNTFSASALNHITLNVNSEGAYPIYFGDTEDPIGANPVAFGKADFIHYYLYDGVHWIYIANSGVQTAEETPFSAPGFAATNAKDAIVEAAENGGLLPHVVVSVETGSTVTLTKGGITITATETSTGVYEADIDSYGSWTVTASKSGATATDTINVDTVKVYNVTLAYFTATITVTYPAGSTCTCTGNGQTQTAQSNPETFTVYAAGTYTLTATDGVDATTKTVTITTDGQSESVTLSYVPEGSTVTPTDDIQTWLACAQITDKSYTTLNEVLADSTTLAALMADNNAVDYLVRSTTWASGITSNALAMHDIGINNYCANTLKANSTWLTAIVNSSYIDNVLNTKVPLMTSSTVPYGEASAGNTYGTNPPKNAFDHDDTTMWMCQNTSASYLQYEFPQAVVVNAVRYKLASDGAQSYLLQSCLVSGSNNGTDFTSIGTVTFTNSLGDDKIYPLSNSTAYKYYRISTFTSSGTHIQITEFNFYGREDVPSTITKKTFATATDAEINEMCKWSERGVIDLETDCGWAVGQEHTFTLGAIATTGTFNGITWSVGEAQSSQSVTVVLTRKGGAELVSPVLSTDGTSRSTPAFEWDYKDCLGTKGYMNSTNTNTGSWGTSARRSWCNSGLLQQMLAVLPMLCNLFKVITAKTYNGSENETTNDYFALRAAKEVGAAVNFENETEAAALTQAPYYDVSANRIKKVNGADSEWWHRGPYKAESTKFTNTSINGGNGTNNASNTFGIAPFGGLG